MNRIVTFLAETLIELGYSIATARAPNPFQLPDEARDGWLSDQPDEFYAAPAAPPDLKFHPLAEVRGSSSFPQAAGDVPRTSANGERLARFSFPSSFPSPHPQNNTVYGLADLHFEPEVRGSRSSRKGTEVVPRTSGTDEPPRTSARAALIFLHGHMMTRATLFPLLWYARTAIGAGFDAYYMNLPYHMRRAPKGTYSGQYVLNSDVPGTAMAFRQGVKDVRSLITWIEHTQRLPVVLAGISLGAYTACMTAVVDPRPRAVVSILGGASLARIPWDGYQAGKIRRQLRQRGVTLEQLERWWALLSPGNWQPRIDRERVVLLGGKYDEIVTPANVRGLWRAWGEPRLLWYPCGHVTSALYHRQVSADLAGFTEQKIL
jgi:pimeloyl-ACP methyl ester carboxylesterase